MNIVFVVKTLDQGAGGAERVLASVTSGLVRRGHRVTVASFDLAGSTDFFALDPQIRRVRLAGRDAQRRSGPIDVLARARALREAVQDALPDVAVGFMHSAFVPLGWAMLGTRIPVIASEHIDLSYYRLHLAERLAVRSSLPRFAAMTIPSEAVRDGYGASLRSKMVVIPNPVAIAPVASEQVQRDRTILSIGRLAPQKDQRTLIEAFSRIAPRYPDWTLRILGEGELRGALEAQVASLGLGDRVFLPGVSATVDADYARAAIFVLPSLFESFGLVTAEALAHGLPAVGFADCAGTNELIQHRVNGLLADGPDRVTALAACLAELIGSEPLRRSLGEAGPASVARFSIDSVVDKWEALLTSVAARYPRRSGG